MAWKPIKLTENLDADLGGSRIKVDEGDYLGEIAGIRPSPKEYDKEPYWLWQIRIKKGSSSIGRTIGYFGSFEDRLQFQNGRLFAAIGAKNIAQQLVGMEIETYEDFVKITERVANAVKGKELGFFAADSRKDPDKSSDVIEVYSKEEYEARMAVTGGVSQSHKTTPAVTVEVSESGETVTVEASTVKRGPKPPKAAAEAPAAPAKKSVDQMLADFGLE